MFTLCDATFADGTQAIASAKTRGDCKYSLCVVEIRWNDSWNQLVGMPVPDHVLRVHGPQALASLVAKDLDSVFPLEIVSRSRFSIFPERRGIIYFKDGLEIHIEDYRLTLFQDQSWRGISNASIVDLIKAKFPSIEAEVSVDELMDEEVVVAAISREIMHDLSQFLIHPIDEAPLAIGKLNRHSLSPVHPPFGHPVHSVRRALVTIRRRPHLAL